LDEPVLLEIGIKHGRTAAQIIATWMWYTKKVVLNIRTSNVAHMVQNLQAFTDPIELDHHDIKAIESLPQNTCDNDPDFYECGGTW